MVHSARVFVSCCVEGTFDFHEKIKIVSLWSLNIVPIESGIAVNEITATTLSDAALLHEKIAVRNF